MGMHAYHIESYHIEILDHVNKSFGILYVKNNGRVSTPLPRSMNHED
jgi:hypothetical protein